MRIDKNSATSEGENGMKPYLVSLVIAGVLLMLGCNRSRPGAAAPECLIPESASLPLSVNPQELNNWCWAASGQMVMKTSGRMFPSAARQTTSSNLALVVRVRQLPMDVIKVAGRNFKGTEFGSSARLAKLCLMQTCKSKLHARNSRWHFPGNGLAAEAT